MMMMMKQHNVMLQISSIICLCLLARSCQAKRTWIFPETARSPLEEVEHELRSGEAELGLDKFVKLCNSDESLVKSIASAGVLTEIVIDLLESQVYRSKAIQVISSLSARYDELGNAFLQKRGVSVIIKLLNDPSVQVATSKMISILAEGSTDRQQRLSGAVSILQRAAASLDTDRDIVALALCRLAESNPPPDQPQYEKLMESLMHQNSGAGACLVGVNAIRFLDAMVVKGMLDRLLDMISCCEMKAMPLAAEIISRFFVMRDSARFLPILLSSRSGGMQQHLLNVLRGDNGPEAAAASFLLLQHFAEKKTNHDTMLQLGVIEKAAEIVEKERGSIQAAAATTLYHLSLNPVAFHEFAKKVDEYKEGGGEYVVLKKLPFGLKYGNPETQMRIAGSIANLAIQPSQTPVLVKSHVVEPLVEMFDVIDAPSHPKRYEMAARAMFNIGAGAAYDMSINAMTHAGGTHAVVRCLKNDVGDRVSREFCSGALLNIFVKDLRSHVVAAGLGASELLKEIKEKRTGNDQAINYANSALRILEGDKELTRLGGIWGNPSFVPEASLCDRLSCPVA